MLAKNALDIAFIYFDITPFNLCGGCEVGHKALGNSRYQVCMGVSKIDSSLTAAIKLESY